MVKIETGVSVALTLHHKIVSILIQDTSELQPSPGVLCGMIVKCLTVNLRVLGSNHTGSSELLVSLGKTLQSPSQVLMKTRKDMNNVSCCCDMTEILLKAT